MYRHSSGKTFVQIINTTRGRYLFLVKGKNDGRDAWYYVLVDKPKLVLYERALEAGDITLGRYGKILYKGWGKHPPKDVQRKIKKEFL